MRRTLMLLGLLALVMALATSSWAQTSTLSGTVRDASGAVVPGVAITVKNQASGDERKTVTTKEGNFSVPALQAGTYSVLATAQGFAKYTATDVVLTTNDARSIQVTLPLATVTDTVEVSAQTTSIVIEDSGAKGQTISADDISNMVLGSRSAAEIVKLMAGANITANYGVNKPATTTVIGMNSYQVGGTAAGLGGTTVNGQTVDITMDGGHTFDPGSPGQNSVVNPNVDMISEVKVLASSFSAENDYGPVVMNVSTKGGGDKYHGQAHFYAQHSAMNTYDSFAKANKTPKLDAHQYYPGGSFGGPIPLWGSYNKKHDKLFFWNGFDAYRQLLDGGVARAIVPTDRMLTGDFSTSALAGLKNTGLANKVPYINSDPAKYPAWYKWYTANVPGYSCTITAGVLSAGCIHPVGKKYLSMYPKPNVDPFTHDGYNFVTSTLAPNNSWQNVSRVDWSISDNTKVFVRYSAQRERGQNPMGLWASTSGDNVIPALTPAVGPLTSDALVASLTHVFSPTMTSETTFSLTLSKMPTEPGNPDLISRTKLGLPANMKESIFGQDRMASYGGTGVPGISPGAGYGKGLKMKADKTMPSLKENLTKVYSTHTFKVGAFWEKIHNSQDTFGNFGGNHGGISWDNGHTSNNNMADILMGITTGGYQEEEQIPVLDAYSQQFRFFVTDHWKITRKLTVDVGMRFDHMGRPSTGNSLGLAIWDEAAYIDDPAVVNSHPGVLWHGKDPSVPVSGARSRALFYSPRFGLAYDIFGNGRTVLRGGYGKFRSYDMITADAVNNSLKLGWGASSISCAGDQLTQCPTMDAAYSYLAQYKGHTLPGSLPKGRFDITAMDPTNDEVPLVTTYNLQIDQKLPAKFMMEMSYVGNYGEHNQGTRNINVIPLGRIDAAQLFACTNSNNCPSWNDTPGYRPRQNYKGINVSSDMGKKQFDSLQVSLHRSVGILNLMANYTWSKRYGVSTYGGALPRNGVDQYWGVDRENRSQALNLAYTVNVPKLKTGNRILRGAANGWQISGITQYNAGANLRSAAGDNLSYSYDDLWSMKPDGKGGTTRDQLLVLRSNSYRFGTGDLTVFPTVVCNPVMNKTVTWTDNGKTYTGKRFLNPDCFKPTESGFGNSHMPSFPGPAYFNSDLSIGKNFKVGEHQNLDIRAQAFNFLNHALWSFSGGAWSSDAVLRAQFNDKGQLKSPSSTASINTFGIATKKYGHRTIQFEAKYSF